MGLGSCVLQHGGEESTSIYEPPPGRHTLQSGPLEGGLFPRRIDQDSDQSHPTVTQGPYLSLARLFCADSVADADMYIPRPSNTPRDTWPQPHRACGIKALLKHFTFISTF